MAGMVACAICGAEVEGNYREVTGWEQLRRHRGGLHALIQRTETGRHACDACGFDLKHNTTAAQGRLALGDVASSAERIAELPVLVSTRIECCGDRNGSVRVVGGQRVVRCATCDRFLYNQPKSEAST